MADDFDEGNWVVTQFAEESKALFDSYESLNSFHWKQRVYKEWGNHIAVQKGTLYVNNVTAVDRNHDEDVVNRSDEFREMVDAVGDFLREFSDDDLAEMFGSNVLVEVTADGVSISDVQPFRRRLFGRK